jgi:hypothetical protein
MFITTYPAPNSVPQPCPTCGKCPTCGSYGHGGWNTSPTITWGTQTVTTGTAQIAEDSRNE